MGQGLRLTAVGILFGVLGAAWTSWWLRSQLFEASLRDVVTAIAVAPLALVVAATLACWVPARRALRVPPATAMRDL